MSVSTVGDTLVIGAEEKETGERWRGEFSSRYIEEITHKVNSEQSNERLAIEPAKACTHHARRDTRPRTSAVGAEND